VSGGVIHAAVCGGGVLLGIALGYYAGTRRHQFEFQYYLRSCIHCA